MVARIKTPGSIVRALNYNEQKVNQGHAVLLYAANYLKDSDKLNFTDKLKRFENLIALNERAKTNSLHISLNFDNADKLSGELLTEIASEYMIKIGFGEQPYLVYQHHDAGHPHLHIVTTSIKGDGKRIDTFNIGRNQSEKARQELEKKYGLIQANGRKQHEQKLKPVNAQKIQYGKSETHRAITNVLDTVLNNYKYTSLPELNAVLQLYNVVADRGDEGSRIYKNNGLVYRILDSKGKKVGVPIKASLIYSKPTLKSLEEKFEQNKTVREKDKLRIKNAIDLALLKNQKHALQSLIRDLEKGGINTVVRQNSEGFIYGLTYVDHQTKSVFNSSVIGKQYGARAMQERCSQKVEQLYKTAPNERDKEEIFSEAQAVLSTSTSNQESFSEKSLLSETIGNLLQPEHQFENVPYQLKKNRKKKRKPTSHRL